MIFLLMTALAAPLTPQSLHSTAVDYYEWQKREFPVDASDQGFHAYDDRLTDYSSEAVAKRAAHVHALLEKVRAATPDGWSKDDKIDLILFTAQLERADFGDRVMKTLETNPDVYVGEATNAIFSLLKKEYDTPANRARFAAARLRE